MSVQPAYHKDQQRSIEDLYVLISQLVQYGFWDGDHLYGCVEGALMELYPEEVKKINLEDGNEDPDSFFPPSIGKYSEILKEDQLDQFTQDLRNALDFTISSNDDIDFWGVDESKKTLSEAVKDARDLKSYYQQKTQGETPKHVVDDRETFLKLLKRGDTNILCWDTPDKLKNDKEIGLAAVSSNGGAFFDVSDQLKQDREIILTALENTGYRAARIMSEVPEAYKDDREIVLASIKANIDALEHASDKLKNDKPFMLQAISINVESSGYVGDKLKNDKEVAIAAVKKNGSHLGVFSDEIKGNKDIVLEAIQQDADSLQYASNELKNDKEVVLEAIQQDADSLQYASSELKNDKETVLEAVKQSVVPGNNSLFEGGCFSDASDELRKDKAFVIKLIEITGHVLPFASKELEDDDELKHMAVLKMLTVADETTINEVDNLLNDQ